MKKLLLVLALTAGVVGCVPFGPSAQEIALAQKVAVLEAKKDAGVDVDAELAVAKAELAKAREPSGLEGLLTSDGAIDLLKLAGPPGAIAGYLLMLWRRQRANVRALVAGGEAVLEAVDKGGLTRETAKVAMREAQEKAGAGKALYNEIATLKAQIRAQA